MAVKAALKTSKKAHWAVPFYAPGLEIRKKKLAA